jgi:hypothetical protein
VVKKKGDREYAARNKQMMISLINDYSLFGAHNQEIIQMLSQRYARKYQKLFSIS